jgi:hypothetical protein
MHPTKTGKAEGRGLRAGRCESEIVNKVQAAIL